jgi:hypothetical protein
MRKIKFTILLIIVLVVGQKAFAVEEACLVYWPQQRVGMSFMENGKPIRELAFDSCGITQEWFGDPPYSLDSIMYSEPGYYESELKRLKRIYAKGVYDLFFNNIMPFDTAGKNLYNMNYFVPEDISDLYPQIKSDIQLLKAKYGNFKIYYSLEKKMTIGTCFDQKKEANPTNTYWYIEFDNLVNSYEFEEYLLQNIASFSGEFVTGFVWPLSIVSNEKFINSVIITPNPAESIIKIENPENISTIKIFRFDGIMCSDIKNVNGSNSAQVSIENLFDGSYYVIVNDANVGKFIIDR